MIPGLQPNCKCEEMPLRSTRECEGGAARPQPISARHDLTVKLFHHLRTRAGEARPVIRPSGSLKSTKTGSEVSAMLTLPAESRTMSRMKTRNGRFRGSITLLHTVVCRLEEHS